MELIKKTRKLGNSAGVLLPKNLLGAEVKVTVVKHPVDIKKEALKHLEEYFGEIQGIYIINKKPIEVLAISSSIKKIINDRQIKFSIVPLSVVKRDLKTKSVLKQKLILAEPILNRSLLFELKKELRGEQILHEK